MIVEAVQWSALASEMLAGSVISASVEDYRRQVEAGAVLFRVSDETGILGYYILRLDRHAEKTIGVLVCAAGVAGHSFAADLMPVIEGQFSGVDEIHQYASRPGMVRQLVNAGWHATHLVMVKRVKNG